MSEKNYAIVGSWDFQKKEGKGISLFSYDPETASMKFIANYRDDVSVGNQFFYSKNDILYITNEERNLRGQLGGGGYILAFQLDRENGKLNEICEVSSISTLPSYFWLDISGRYAVVSDHVTGNYVTKIIRNNDGTVSSKVVSDDGAIILYRINKDGSIGEAVDACIIPSEEKIYMPNEHARAPKGIPHLHSVKADPSCNLYVSCDKGLDKIYTFALNRENGKLTKKGEFSVDPMSAPRYCVFHPLLPIVYTNNEAATFMYTFKYNVTTGELELLAKTHVLGKEGERGMPSDIIIDKNGKYLYHATRGANIISVFSIDDNGLPTLIQKISSNGDPRGISLSPDGRFLFSANQDNSTIAIFKVGTSGTLSDIENPVSVPCPGNIVIV